MEFLVEFELVVPAGTPQSEIDERERAASAATTQLTNEGHLVRVWSTAFSKTGGPSVIGLYRADGASELEDLLRSARSIRHGDADVLARLARGDEVDAGEYIFRAAAQIETSASDLVWLNKGVFISVGGRSSGGVAYDTYIVE